MERFRIKRKVQGFVLAAATLLLLATIGIMGIPGDLARMAIAQ